MTLPAKSRSGAKLHWSIIIARVGYMNRNGYRMFMLALFVNDTSLCECWPNLLSHLHSRLHISGLLHTNPSLNITLQTIEKMEQGFSIINVNTLSIPFRETYNIVSDGPSLGPFCQRLSCFECIVRWLEVVQQRDLQVWPTRHITLYLKPGVGMAFQQAHNNLTTLNIIS